MKATARSRIAAINTRYAGHWFRSRLEARWALFFNVMGIKWTYEPEGFSLPSAPSGYLPDFLLPRLSLRQGEPWPCWVEIKPRFSEQAQALLQELSEATGHHAILLASPKVTNYSWDAAAADSGTELYQCCADTELCQCGAEPISRGAARGLDYNMTFIRCAKCKRVWFDYAKCDNAVCWRCDPVDRAARAGSWDDPLILLAVEAANSARFEKGRAIVPKEIHQLLRETK